MTLESELAEILPPPPLEEPGAPYPVDALPSPLAEYVGAAAASCHVPPEMVSTALLPSLAAAARHKYVVELKAGWDEPLVLWSCTICESGSGKSPALGWGAKFIRELEKAARKKNSDERARVDASNAERAKGTPPDSYPPDLRYTTERPTPEVLGLLLERNPVILVLADELGGLVRDFGKYGGGGESAVYLSLYDAAGMTFDRKAEGASTCAERGGVCLSGGLQPAIAKAVLGGEHSQTGFAGRFLMCWPERLPRRWTDDTVDTNLVDDVRAIFQFVDNTTRHPSGEPYKLTLAPDALAEFIAFNNRIGDRGANLQGFVASAYSKGIGHAARLAGTFHLAEMATGRASGGMTVIGADAMRRAIRIAEWHLSEAERIGGLLERDMLSPKRGVPDALNQIRKAGGEMTVRDWQHLHHLPDRAHAEAELRKLAKSGHGTIEERTPDRGGPRSKVFILSGEPRL